MKKIIVGISIMAVFIILQACSKKDNAPVATGYEGVWTGKVSIFSPDSIQLNLKLGGAADGKLAISPDGSAADTIYGNWAVVDTLITITTLSTNTMTQRFYTFFAKANKNILDGRCAVVFSGMGGKADFHVVRKK